MSNGEKKSWITTGAVVLSLITAVAAASSWAVTKSVGFQVESQEKRLDKVESAVLQIPAINSKVELLLQSQQSLQSAVMSYMQRGDK